MSRTCWSIPAEGVLISEGSLRLVRICCVAGVAEIEVVGSSAVEFCGCGGGDMGDELRCVNCVCVCCVAFVYSSFSCIRMIVSHSSSDRIVVVSREGELCVRRTEAESSSLSVQSPRTTVASSNDRMLVGFCVVFILANAANVREEVGCVVGGCCDDSSEGGRVGEKEGRKMGEDGFDQLLLHR